MFYGDLKPVMRLQTPIRQGFFIRDTACFQWKHAVSRMKMPAVREFATSTSFIINITSQFLSLRHQSFDLPETFQNPFITYDHYGINLDITAIAILMNMNTSINNLFRSKWTLPLTGCSSTKNKITSGPISPSMRRRISKSNIIRVHWT